ncbi:MAG: NADPH-dependent 7-cyano-7-deazaguanine reductase QueF [Deltaproteobacteria bacterium RIFCSPHIGHO2_02_FULL_40_11]|nr:MAG: NADPH-dependent 7-cyano-7-deazaguanine reductase QueF [Deltaproteobacteria bacterium RIFCSPHIGHO2_02_FULL_40_11]
MTQRYTEKHAKSGLNAKLPKLETFPNQFQGYDITISYPEFTSICPKTGLPDMGTLTLKYRPKKKCLELKSLKMYMLAYRNLGIFYENVVNRMLQDFVKATEPEWMVVKGVFNARGGMVGQAEVTYGKVSAGAENYL